MNVYTSFHQCRLNTNAPNIVESQINGTFELMETFWPFLNVVLCEVETTKIFIFM